MNEQNKVSAFCQHCGEWYEKIDSNYVCENCAKFKLVLKGLLFDDRKDFLNLQARVVICEEKLEKCAELWELWDKISPPKEYGINALGEHLLAWTQDTIQKTVSGHSFIDVVLKAYKEIYDKRT